MNIAGNGYVLNSSTIDSCRILFNWAPLPSTKAAIKHHILLNLRDATASCFHISDGKLHNMNVLVILPI